MYMYMYVYVYVCVCERASEPKRETAKLIKIKGALKPSTHPLFFFGTIDASFIFLIELF